jgi:hypothetical protein
VVLGFMTQIVLRRFVRVGRMLLAGVVVRGGLFAMSKWVGAAALPLGPAEVGNGDFLGTTHRLSGYGIGAAFPTTLDLGCHRGVDVHRPGPLVGLLATDRTLVLFFGVVARLGVSFADPATIITAIALAAAARLWSNSSSGR